MGIVQFVSMNRFIKTVVLAGAFSFFLSRPAIATNLLQNSGFENVIDGKPTDWNPSASTISYASINSSAHWGSFSVSVTKSSSGYGFIFQEVNIDPAKKYKFSGWSLWNDSAITNVKLRIEWYGSDQSSRLKLDEVALPQKDSSFQFLEIASMAPPEGAVKVKVEAYIYLNTANPTQPALFDDLNFEETTGESSTIPTASPTSFPTSTNQPPTPTPTSTPNATYKINEVKDQNGQTLSSVKIYVDDVYIHHYAPETLTFCEGCKCDTEVSCGFGEHTIKLEKTGFQNWSETKNIISGETYEVNPVMKISTANSPTPTAVSTTAIPTFSLTSTVTLTKNKNKNSSSNSATLSGEILGDALGSSSSSEATNSTEFTDSFSSKSGQVSGNQSIFPKILLILSGICLLSSSIIILWRRGILNFLNFGSR